MIARRYIIPEQSYAHVFFRCQNREFFLEPPEIKEYLIFLWAKYKQKYGIRIFEAIVMDNHAHLLIQSPSAEALGNFMRVVNSLLARYINHYFDRDSQALRERYKSPMITSARYFRQTMAYIWLNRYKVNKSDPVTDRYCSASWRYYPHLLENMGGNDAERSMLKNLLDTDPGTYPDKMKEIRRFITDTLSRWMNEIENLALTINRSSHTIGDVLTQTYRSDLFRTLKKEAIPWQTQNLDLTSPA